MKILTLSATALAAAVILTAATGNRQVTENDKSPDRRDRRDVRRQEGNHRVQRALRRAGRKVEGGLIPFTSIYRMGADAATTLTTETDLMIGDLHVPKGIFTLYLQAKEDGNWQLVVNKQTKQWGTVYNQDQDLGRATMKVSRLGSPVETFKIALAPKGSGAAELSVEWGNTKATVPVKAI